MNELILIYRAQPVCKGRGRNALLNQSDVLEPHKIAYLGRLKLPYLKHETVLTMR